MDKENYCVKIASHLGLSHQHMNFRGHSSVHSTWLWLFKESSKQCSCWPRLLCSGPTQPAFSLISKVLEPLDFPRFPIYPLRITVRKIRHLKGLTSPFFFFYSSLVISLLFLGSYGRSYKNTGQTDPQIEAVLGVVPHF